MPDWPHSPVHRLSDAGTYMVTAATYEHALHFRGEQRLEYLQGALFEYALKFGWKLEAWSLFPNHYHFVGMSQQPQNLRPMLTALHSKTAIAANELDQTDGRQVWFSFWDTQITYQRSYLARLNYVHQNPVHHGLVRDARSYRWCSAAWLERTASPSFRKTLGSFGMSRIKVVEPPCDCWE